MSRRRRLFFALEPGDRVRQQILSVQKSLAVEGRPVAPKQYHVTLAFLGMQPPELIPSLQSVSSRLVLSPCEVTLDRIGCFRKAGVLWLGSQGIPTELTAFREALVGGIEQIGIDRDRKPWEFHLTLYRRLRKPSPIIAPEPVKWMLDSFSLIESVSVPGGVEYHRQGHWKCGPQVD